MYTKIRCHEQADLHLTIRSSGGFTMAFYRYSASYPGKDGEITTRSLTPFSLETEKNPYYCHRCYTSEKDDSSYYYVISLGHEKGWSNKSIGPRTVDRFIIHYVVEG